MKNDRVKHDLTESNTLFMKHIAPILMNNSSGYFKPVEGVDNQTAKDLDQLAGIDYCYYLPDNRVYGVASRVQVSQRNWRTFTIRYERESGSDTEYIKRLKSMNSGAIFPFYTIQAYIVGERVYIGVVKTKVLINYILNGGIHTIRESRDQNGYSRFYVVNWEDVQASVYEGVSHV